MSDKKTQGNEWSRLYGRRITEEEYHQICGNLESFFNTLQKWDKEASNEAQKDNT